MVAKTGTMEHFKSETLPMLVGIGLGAFILFLFWCYQSKSINSLEIYQLEEWVEEDYPIGNDIAEYYRDDDKISNWEYKRLANKIAKLDQKKLEEDTQRRMEELAGLKQ